MKALVSAYFTDTKGDRPLESLIGHLGTFDSKMDANDGDWPLRTNAKNDMEKPITLILERPMSTTEWKPRPPPKDRSKLWEGDVRGGITVTERYSVVSAPTSSPLGSGDGSRKGKNVLGA